MKNYFSMAFRYRQTTPVKSIVGDWDWQSYVKAEEELQYLCQRLGNHVRIKHGEASKDGYLYKYAMADVDEQTLSEVIERVSDDIGIDYLIGCEIILEDGSMDPEKDGCSTLSEYMTK